MVLQRAPQKANIWGWTTAGATVTVTFNQKTYTATSSATGAWNTLLDATSAGGPYTIDASSSSGEKAQLTDILFGDVYVCSGQSNMQFTVHSAFNATEEIQAADKYSSIRLFTVGQGTSSATPLTEFTTISQGWSVASATTVGVGDWNEFSAACWFFLAVIFLMSLKYLSVYSVIIGVVLLFKLGHLLMPLKPVLLKLKRLLEDLMIHLICGTL